MVFNITCDAQLVEQSLAVACRGRKKSLGCYRRKSKQEKKGNYEE